METEFGKCPDCQVEVGQLHQFGCDISRCKVSGYQLLGCYEDPDDPDHEEGWKPDHECYPCIWTGEWPGVAFCRKYGLYAKVVGIGWTEDLNIVQVVGIWNSELEDWEPRK